MQFAAWIQVALLAATSGAFAAVGCAQILGTDDFSDAPLDAGVDTGLVPDGGSDGGTEGCLDRVDNNGDGLADCQDPQCAAGYVCVELPGDGTLGVGWLYRGATLPNCELGEELDLHDPADLSAEPGSCSCSCSEPVNAVCTALLRCSTSCNGAPSGGAIAASNCAPWVPSYSPSSCTSDEAWLSAEADACAPQAANTLPPPEWPVGGRACWRSTGGHCPLDNQICVPRPPAGASFPCVAVAGDAGCPGDASAPIVMSDGSALDERGCDTTGCSCSHPSGEDCSCTETPCGIRVFSDGNCQVGGGLVANIVPDGGNCVSGADVATDASVLVVGASVTTPGSCAPSGVASPTGGVSADGLVTFCCQGQ